MEVLKTLPAVVDCCITSPPYWNLRDYKTTPVLWDADPQCDHEWQDYPAHLQHENRNFQVGTQEEVHQQKRTTWIKKYDETQAGFCKKCGGWYGSLGGEPNPDLYVKHLVDIFAEVKRVLKPIGTLWVVIGDTSSSHTDWRWSDWQRKVEASTVRKQYGALPSKCLVQVPSRFALAMVEAGWVLRNDIIWHKPNCTPKSSKDCFTIDYEHIFFFTQNTKKLFWTNSTTQQLVTQQPLGIQGVENVDWRWVKCPRCKKESTPDPACKRCQSTGYYKRTLWVGHDYYFEQQLEPVQTKVKQFQYTGQATKAYEEAKAQNPSDTKRRILASQQQQVSQQQPLVRNKRCVWRIPTIPYKEAHFATFNTKLLEIPLNAGCPLYICKQCGWPRIRRMRTSHPISRDDSRNKRPRLEEGRVMQEPPEKGWETIKVQQGWIECQCHAGWQPGIVLDPFMGAGTTGVAARQRARDFLGIDLSDSYIELANERIAPYLNKKIEDFI